MNIQTSNDKTYIEFYSPGSGYSTCADAPQAIVKEYITKFLLSVDLAHRKIESDFTNPSRYLVAISNPEELTDAIVYIDFTQENRVIFEIPDQKNKTHQSYLGNDIFRALSLSTAFMAYNLLK